MAKRKDTTRKIPVDLNVLSEEDRRALDMEAQASVAAEMKQDARDAYFQAKTDELRRGHTPEDQLVNVTIDVAPYVPNIMLDGVQYFHGYTYEVPMKRACVLYEQMQRSWAHQDEIDGRGRSEAYRRPNNRVLGKGDAGTSTRGVNGPVVAEL